MSEQFKIVIIVSANIELNIFYCAFLDVASLSMLNVNANELGDEGMMLIARTLDCNFNVLTKLKIAGVGKKFTSKGMDIILYTNTV